MTVLAATDPDAVLEAMGLLDAGELVVVPTDTSYALAGDALDERSVERIFHATGRAADRPLPVGVSGLEDLGHVGFLTALARDLAARHWPGPLTMVLRARPWLPDPLTAGGDTVAARAPALEFPRDLARHFGPLALPTARRPGAPAARTIEEARRLFGAEAALYVDAGALPGGRSTVVDATGGEAKVLSDGKVPAAEVAPDGRGRP